MPKLKTHRGAAKRFKRTGTGKIVRSKAFKQHILTSKARSRKRKLRGTVEVSDGATELQEARIGSIAASEVEAPSGPVTARRREARARRGVGPREH